MRFSFSDVDLVDHVDYEIHDKLPVVNSWRICFLYATGTVDDQRYVQQTRCNRREKIFQQIEFSSGRVRFFNKKLCQMQSR